MISSARTLPFTYKLTIIPSTVAGANFSGNSTAFTAVYADTWSAVNAEGNPVAQGMFEAGPLSRSTGYKYATLPTDVSRITISTKQQMWLNGTTNDIRDSFTISDPSNDGTYELTKQSGSIVVDLKSSPVAQPQQEDSTEGDDDEDYEIGHAQERKALRSRSPLALFCFNLPSRKGFLVYGENFTIKC